MKATSPYATAEFRSNLIVMPKPVDPEKLGIVRGLAYASPAIVLFWAIVFYAVKELVR